MCSTVLAAGCAESAGGSVKIAGGTDWAGTDWAGTDWAGTCVQARQRFISRQHSETRIMDTSCKRRPGYQKRPAEKLGHYSAALMRFAPRATRRPIAKTDSPTSGVRFRPCMTLKGFTSMPEPRQRVGPANAWTTIWPYLEFSRVSPAQSAFPRKRRSDFRGWPVACRIRQLQHLCETMP